MIPKERFLAGINELFYVEEGFVAILTNLIEALVRESGEISDVRKNEILKMLSILRADSVTHKETLKSLIRKIEGDSKNEY